MSVAMQPAPESFAGLWDCQVFMAQRLGGSPNDYFHGKSETREAAIQLDILPQFEAAVETMHATDPQITSIAARFSRREPHARGPAMPAYQPSAKHAPGAAVALLPRFPRVWLDDAQPILAGRYIVKGLLDLGNFGVVFGPSGDGKTFFTLDMVAHVPSGMPWRGHRVRQGLVVYVAAEAGVSILKRFYAWREKHLAEGREGRTPLAIITRGTNLLNMVDVEGLIDELRIITTEAGIPLAVVVFDTLSRSMPGGDENSAMDMTAVVASCDYIRDTLGAATLVIHHSGKDASKGARGHSSLFAAADCVLSVTDRVATLEKARDGHIGEQFPFDLEIVQLGEDEDGDPVTTCIVRPTDTPSTPSVKGTGAALSGVARVAMQSLIESVDEHGEKMGATSSIPGGVLAVHIDRWRDRFVLRYGTDKGGESRSADTVDRTFRRGREALLKAEAVGISNPYCWLKSRP